MPMLVGVLVLVSIFGNAAGEGLKNRTHNGQLPLHQAFREAFSKEGVYREEYIDKIQLEYYKEGIDTNRWPFTNRGEELMASGKNPHNHNAEQVRQAITDAGGNPDDKSTLSEDVIFAAISILQNEDLGASGTGSLLQTGSGLDPNAGFAASAQYLSTGISMTTGSVAANTNVIAGLAGTVAQNTLAIGGLSSTVAVMSSVTGPTVAMAGALGVPIATVSSMALAGAFVGPMLGVIGIVYAAWPEEDVDPFFKVEERVAQMISQKFDAKRRKRLGDRLRRYIKQFSRCSQGWVADGLINLNGVTIPRWIVKEAQLALGEAGRGGDFIINGDKSRDMYAAPPCAGQLEGHMSLERDEWFKTDKGQMSGLFMPFANMHTQVLSMLTDHPYDDKMQWGESLKTTAAEYGDYMMTHLLKAWKAQVCRTMRLRTSSGLLSGTYELVVLKAIAQPNAGADCSGKCESGKWCDYCGGTNQGACCESGQGGICKKFDVPLTWAGSKYSACVHNDCLQSNSAYYGTVLKEVGAWTNGAPRTDMQCQSFCQSVPNAVVFSSQDAGKTCKCLAQIGLKRHFLKGASSGPTVCKGSGQSLKEMEDDLTKSLNETTRVPMEEVSVCQESPSVSNVADLEATQAGWLSDCYKQATQHVTVEFNTFYLRFARFVDMLSWKAQCGARHSVRWEITAKGNGFEEVSNELDAGSFHDCDWEKQESNDKGMWVWDQTASKGWTGSSKIIMDEQAKMKTQYPMPAWLHDLRKVHTCMKSTAAGAVTDSSNGISSAIEGVMDPAAIDDSRLQETPAPNDEYARMLEQMRAGDNA